MGKRKSSASNKPRPQTPLRNDATRQVQRLSLFEVALLLPWTYGLVPLASLLHWSVRTAFWLSRVLVIAVVWSPLVLLHRLFVVYPSQALRTLRGWVALPGASETRSLRTALTRVEKRLRRAEQLLQQQNATIQRLLHDTSRLRPEAAAAAAAAVAALPSPPLPLLAGPAAIAAPAPMPPPPPPPTLPRAPLFALLAKRGNGASSDPLGPAKANKNKNNNMPTVTLQDLMRVKLRSTAAGGGGDAASESSGVVKKGLRSGLSVSLADITNVQLRRSAGRQGSRGSPLKAAPVEFKLKRVQGIERSPGGTPIRPDIVRSSHNNTVDKFAIALKKKFESSLITSPRSARTSPAASPNPPRTPVSLNASFAASPAALSSSLLSSVSFLDSSSSSALSPIRPDRL